MAKQTKSRKSDKLAKPARTSGNGKSEPDAIALLKADHRAVEALFEKFENTKGAKAKHKLAQQICMELIVHTQIEEEIFYPASKAAVEEDIYTEAQVEHDGAKMLIAEILVADPEGEFYDASVHVLSEMIKHHVKEEEQRGGMFSQARDSNLDLKTLGAEMSVRKTALKRIYGKDGLPHPTTRTLQSVPEVELGQPVEALDA